MRFISIVGLITTLWLSTAADDSPDKDACVYHVGEDYSESCDIRDEIDVINRRGFRSTFKKMRRSARSWYGENDLGASLSYLRSTEDQIFGSLVDVENDEVTQIRVSQGSPVAITTASSDFGEELEPPNEVEPKGRKLSLNTSMEASSTAGFHDNEQDTSTKSLQTDSMIQNLKDTILQQGMSRGLDDSGDVLDVMVVWTKDAECKNAGFVPGCTLTASTDSSMRALIDLAVEETNTAYEISGANTELLLVHAYRHPTYTASSFNGALDDVTDNTVDGVHENREQYGADIVALIIDDPQYCGIAWLGPSKNLMYSVTAWNCATGYYSFGHEIGHNLGLQHDRGTQFACSNSGYNFGYRDTNGGFRSILAYSCAQGQCDNNPGGSCTRIIRFSNPNSGWQGSPVGNAENDNVRKINDVRATVAAYYPHYISEPTVSPAPTAPPTPCNGDELTVLLVTDNYASETSWEVRSVDNTVVMSNGAISNGQTYTTTQCLNQGCGYTFLIEDSFGDGICCSHGSGSVTVSLAETEIFVASDFGSSASHDFCVESTIDGPTKSPTAAPTPSPTVPCLDAGFPMAFTDYGATAVECNFISALASECLCSDAVIQSHCPLACDSCDIYKCVDSAASWTTPSGSVATCTALGNLSSADLDNFCGLSSQLRTTCPATCGVCD